MRLCVTAFVQNCFPRGSDVNTKGSDMLVGQLRKSGMCTAFIYLFYLFFFFLLECLWSAKTLRIEGQLAITKSHFWTVYFSPGTCAGSDHD